jgi:16S rRNA (guanine966-N2)-methyltransferase
MSEKARGALFNALGDIKGLTVLDAYAGSGAVAIEAISRGASQATAIDVDVEAIKAIANNVRELDLSERITVLRKNISGWSRNNQQRKYDIVVADPPYTDIRPDVLERLSVHVVPGGVYVLSWPGREKVREIPGFTVVTNKPLGDIQLVFYKHD